MDEEELHSLPLTSTISEKDFFSSLMGIFLSRGDEVSKIFRFFNRKSNSGQAAPFGDTTARYVLLDITMSGREISSQSHSLREGPSVYSQKQFSAPIMLSQKFLLVL